MEKYRTWWAAVCLTLGIVVVAYAAALGWSGSNQQLMVRALVRRQWIVAALGAFLVGCGLGAYNAVARAVSGKRVACLPFHRWTKWKQYDQRVSAPGIGAGSTPHFGIEQRQSRRCKVCEKVQDVVVKRDMVGLHELYKVRTQRGEKVGVKVVEDGPTDF